MSTDVLQLILALDVGLLAGFLFCFADRARGRATQTQREQAKDQAMLNSIADGVLATDGRGVVTLFNTACTRMLGWEPEEVIGKKLVDVVKMTNDAGEEILSSQRPLAKTLELGLTSSFTQRYRRKDGSVFPVSITVSPIVFRGRPEGAIAVVRDVTKETQIDKAKTEFVSLASHQLRTPISIINWYLEAILTGETSGLTARQKQFLKQVYESAGRMSELVDTLLNVSRLEMGTFAMKKEEVNLLPLARSLVQELEPELKRRRHRFMFTSPSTFPSIRADRKLVWIILQNLLTNAIKYTPNGGKIALDMTPRGSHVLIHVSDSGVGIPEAQKSRIFLKMFRAQNAQELDSNGSGLGLYIVKSIVEKMGGTIRFTSRIGKGTVFRVKLPR